MEAVGFKPRDGGMTIMLSRPPTILVTDYSMDPRTYVSTRLLPFSAAHPNPALDSISAACSGTGIEASVWRLSATLLTVIWALGFLYPCLCLLCWPNPMRCSVCGPRLAPGPLNLHPHLNLWALQPPLQGPTALSRIGLLRLGQASRRPVCSCGSFRKLLPIVRAAARAVRALGPGSRPLGSHRSIGRS